MLLETDRVRLREITRDDEEKLYDLDSDPEVMKFLSNGIPSSREDIQAAIGRILAMKEKHGGKFGYWAALEKPTGRFMGWFLFRPAHHDAENTKRIELGYRLRKEFWGLGLATEVSKAIINKGFDEYGVEEIFAIAVKGNVGSIAVMKKCGMNCIREFTSDELTSTPEELVEFSLTKRDHSSH